MKLLDNQQEGLEQEQEQPQPQVISFIGTTPNIGTTLAALRHCYHIAHHTMCKVAYICLNLKSSKLHRYLGVSHMHVTLDGLLPSLKNRQLSDATFMQLLYKPSPKHEVYVLFGNQQRELAEQYLEEDLHYLIELAKKHVDYIVVDTSSYWDNAGSFTALKSATHIVITTTDARSNFQEDFQKWFGAISEHLSIKLEQAYLLLIRQFYSDQHYSYKDIVSETNTTPYADSHFPTTVLSYLDRGELLEWLLQSQEAKGWFSDNCHALLNPAHLSHLPPSYQPLTRLYWPWQRNRQKQVVLRE